MHLRADMDCKRGKRGVIFVVCARFFVHGGAAVSDNFERKGGKKS